MNWIFKGEYHNAEKDYQDIDRYYYFKSQVSGDSLKISFKTVGKGYELTQDLFLKSDGEARMMSKKSNGLILHITDPVRIRDFVAAHRFDLFARITRSNFHWFIQSKKYVAIGVITEDKLGRSPDHHIE